MFDIGELVMRQRCFGSQQDIIAIPASRLTPQERPALHKSTKQSSTCSKTTIQQMTIKGNNKKKIKLAMKERQQIIKRDVSCRVLLLIVGDCWVF